MGRLSRSCTSHCQTTAPQETQILCSNVVVETANTPGLLGVVFCWGGGRKSGTPLVAFKTKSRRFPQRTTHHQTKPPTKGKERGLFARGPPKILATWTRCSPNSLGWMFKGRLNAPTSLESPQKLDSLRPPRASRRAFRCRSVPAHSHFEGPADLSRGLNARSELSLMEIPLLRMGNRGLVGLGHFGGMPLEIPVDLSSML